ncbi:MAG: hypothetical protein HYS40_01695 [Gemmatimonadetes bacterium]|nr:hypothetical protein [Gemmatimonadota bacterium]
MMRVLLMPALGHRPEHDRPGARRQPTRGDEQQSEAIQAGGAGHQAPVYADRLRWRNPA